MPGGSRLDVQDRISVEELSRSIKFFLHLSKEEQRKRFLARIDEPDKNWKFSIGDIEERNHWSDFMKAYEACMSATSTRRAPWYCFLPTTKKMP